MISSRVLARVSCASLGFVLLAGSARAQFAECALPSDVPGSVLTTITMQGDLDFGGLTQSVCDSIVKKGISACKTQVKAAAKCGRSEAASIYGILVKQCAQIEDATERGLCKESAKTFLQYYLDGYDGDKQDGLDTCDALFATALNGACMDLVVKVGGE